jgi:hypothetical protein
MHAIDIGPTQAYAGMPEGRMGLHFWPLYSLAYHTHGFGTPHQTTRADTVLVDGRFRAACALAVWTEASPNTTVMIHDYYRKNYHVVELFYDAVERAESLVVLRPNAQKLASPMWQRKAIEMYQAYQYDTA